jgi:hypothetical protein
MEAKMADLLDFDLYVPLGEFNMEANKINLLITKERLEQEAQAKLLRKPKAKKNKNKVLSQGISTARETNSSSVRRGIKTKFNSMQDMNNSIIQANATIESFDLGTLFSEEDDC